MRSQMKVLLVMLALGPVVAWGPRVVDEMAKMQTFKISRVDVEGIRYLTQDSVVAQMRLGQFASVWGDRAEWAERLAEHPLIRHAEVERRLPNGLRVTVEERRPIAFAATPTLEPVDGDGVRLPIDPTRYPLDLPVIAADRLPPANAGVFPEEVRTLAAEIERLEEMDEEFVHRISTIARTSDGSLEIQLVTPEVAILLPEGTSIGRLREGEAALTHAIAQDPGHVPSVVDLRFADQVVIRRAR